MNNKSLVKTAKQLIGCSLLANQRRDDNWNYGGERQLVIAYISSTCSQRQSSLSHHIITYNINIKSVNDFLWIFKNVCKRYNGGSKQIKTLTAYVHSISNSVFDRTIWINSMQ